MAQIGKRYIGDSVYVSDAPHSDWQMVLTTENGLPNDPSNTIYLEYETFKALVEYGKLKFQLS